LPLPCFAPTGDCAIKLDGLPEPGISDVGLIFLDHPAHGIKPAKLGNRDLDGSRPRRQDDRSGLWIHARPGLAKPVLGNPAIRLVNC
jgi:hypothetical protein